MAHDAVYFWLDRAGSCGWNRCGFANGKRWCGRFIGRWPDSSNGCRNINHKNIGEPQGQSPFYSVALLTDSIFFWPIAQNSRQRRVAMRIRETEQASQQDHPLKAFAP